ncbi:MAG: O-antigen ligase family protein [Acidobacteriota bacterium]|nr:O-antigen ligase family protein [Acidobacteriota bacterium]
MIKRARNLALRSPLPPLTLLGLIFAYAVFWHGAVLPETWDQILLALAILGGIYPLMAPSAERAPALPRWLRTVLVLLPGYVVFQLLPLPVSWLRMLSPAKARLYEALGPVALATGSWEPLAVRPAITLLYLLRIVGYLITFLIARQLVHRFCERPWMSVLPIVIVATAEALLGVFQTTRLESADAFAIGTYVNRNHFAGMLEMAFPFAVMRVISLLRTTGPESWSRLVPVARIGAYLMASGLILLGIFSSLSRAGVVAAVFSLTLIASAEPVPMLGQRYRGFPGWSPGWLPGIAVALLLVAGFAAISPSRLMSRFTELATPEIAGMDRRAIWSQTLRVVADYTLTGCGLGGYRATYLRYKTEMPLWTTDFAHNDYLQLLAELGGAGFLIVAAGLMGVLYMAIRGWSAVSSAEARSLSVACTAALGAILIHSLVDFNLYIPANAMEVAWIAGVAVALPETRQNKTDAPFFPN